MPNRQRELNFSVKVNFFENEYFSLSKIRILYGESDAMEIKITKDEYRNMTLKK